MTKRVHGHWAKKSGIADIQYDSKALQQWNYNSFLIKQVFITAQCLLHFRNPQMGYKNFKRQNLPHLNVARNKSCWKCSQWCCKFGRARSSPNHASVAYKRELLPRSSSKNPVSVVRPRTSTVDVSSMKLVSDHAGSWPARSAESGIAPVAHHGNWKANLAASACSPM